MCPLHPESQLPPPSHTIPLGCHRAPALGTLLHASNSPWLSILPMVTYVSMLFPQIILPSPSPTEYTSLSFMSVSPLLPCP